MPAAGERARNGDNTIMVTSVNIINTPTTETVRPWGADTFLAAKLRVNGRRLIDHSRDEIVRITSAMDAALEGEEFSGVRFEVDLEDDSFIETLQQQAEAAEAVGSLLCRITPSQLANRLVRLQWFVSEMEIARHNARLSARRHTAILPRAAASG